MADVPRIRVRNLKTGEVVHSIDAPNMSARELEQVERGLLRNLAEGLFVDTSEVAADIARRGKGGRATP